MKRLRGWVLALLSGLLIAGCGGSDSGGGALSATAKSAVEQESTEAKATVKGYVLSTVIWKQVPIGVCWDMNNADFALYSKERNWSRQAVRESWEEHSDVELTGWQQCTNDPNYYGIRISVEDNVASGPHTMGLGAMLNNKIGGMALNFTFKNWSPSCQGREEYCIRNIAAHEFGHALGFAHEQNRADTPSSCKEPAQGTGGDTMIGPWDLASVMNYCNPEWNGNEKLSATDIAMAQKFYGPPRVRGTYYSATGYYAPSKVTAYDSNTLAVKATIDFPDYQLAGMFASGDNTRVHVALRKGELGSYSVATIDTATNSVLSITDELNAYSSFEDSTLLPSLDGRQFYVLESSSKIGIIDTDSGKVTKRIALLGYGPNKLATAKDDSGSIYVLADDVNAMPRARVILRVDLASGTIKRSYPAGAYPLGNPSNYYKKPEIAVTPDAKKAYFVFFTSPTEGNLAELDLASGNTRMLSDLPVLKPKFLSTVSNQQILFSDDSNGNPNPIVLYDVSKGTKTVASTATYPYQVQYESRTGSIFFADGPLVSVKQLQPLATGDGYSNTKLPLNVGGNSVIPFVFVPG